MATSSTSGAGVSTQVCSALAAQADAAGSKRESEQHTPISEAVHDYAKELLDLHSRTQLLKQWPGETKTQRLRDYRSLLDSALKIAGEIQTACDSAQQAYEEAKNCAEEKSKALEMLTLQSERRIDELSVTNDVLMASHEKVATYSQRLAEQVAQAVKVIKTAVPVLMRGEGKSGFTTKDDVNRLLMQMWTLADMIGDGTALSLFPEQRVKDDANKIENIRNSVEAMTTQLKKGKGDKAQLTGLMASVTKKLAHLKLKIDAADKAYLASQTIDPITAFTGMAATDVTAQNATRNERNDFRKVRYDALRAASAKMLVAQEVAQWKLKCSETTAGVLNEVKTLHDQLCALEETYISGIHDELTKGHASTKTVKLECKTKEMLTEFKRLAKIAEDGLIDRADGALAAMDRSIKDNGKELSQQLEAMHFYKKPSDVQENFAAAMKTDSDEKVALYAEFKKYWDLVHKMLHEKFPASVRLLHYSVHVNGCQLPRTSEGLFWTYNDPATKLPMAESPWLALARSKAAAAKAADSKPTAAVSSSSDAPAAISLTQTVSSAAADVPVALAQQQ